MKIEGPSGGTKLVNTRGKIDIAAQQPGRHHVLRNRSVLNEKVPLNFEVFDDNSPCNS